MSSSREGRAPPPPSSFARTPSSNRSSVSPDNRRQSAIFVGKIPLSILPTSTSTSKDSSFPLHASAASSSSSSSSSSNRSSSSLLDQHQSGQDPSNNDDITTSSSSTFKRPSKSTRRPSLQNGLPSPPFTSSEGSGGSIRLPNQPPQPPPSSFQQSLHRNNSTSSGQSEEDIDNSLVMDGYDQQQHEQAAATSSRRSSLTSSRREQRGGDQERDQRIKDLKERNVKIIDHLATLSSSSSPSNARYSSDLPATPSPTRSSYRTAPPSSSSNSTSSSTKSTRRSSLPAPPPASSNGRLIKPPLRDDAGWEVSAGEETERTYSSGGGSPSGSGGGGWGERDLQQRRPNLPRSGFSGSSAEGGPENYRLPPSLASPSHERTSSLGSDGALSRRSSRSGGSRGPGGGPSASLHTQSQSMSSLDPPSPPPSSSITTTNHNPRVARDAPSSLRTTALHRSQSTSTTGSGSSSGRPALQPRQGSDSSSHSRVVPSPTSNRSRAGSGGSPSSGSLHQTLRISPSVRSTRGSLAGLANSRETSPSPRSQQPPFSAARSTFASRQAVRSNSQASSLASPFASPDKELNGRGSTTETVGRRRANGGETSTTAGGEQRSDERATRERQTSGGAKRRAPLPMEFRNDGSPPEPAPAPPPPRNPRITTTAPTLSKRSVDLDRSSPNRASPEFYSASGSSTLTHNTSPRISRVLPPSRSRTIRGNGYDEQDRPRYLRRGGSAESALAEKDGKRGGEENKGRDLFSRENEKSAAGGTREILARIERETAEREEKKRELLESQALRRAESVMASSEQQERMYQQHQQQQHDRPESSMSRTEDFNRRFPPRTPTASTTRNSVRHTPQTMAPLRPSTAMSSFMDDAPRTAPPIGQHQLRSHRSIYNIQAAAAREDASPSPSQLLRSRNAINNDLSRAAAGTPTRQSTFDRNQSLRRAATPSSASPYHPRAMTSIDFPTSTSSHSNFSASTSSGPLENMVKAFAHLEAYYSPLSLASSDAIIRSANALMSSAESTNTSIAQVLSFTRQQLVDAEVNDMPLDFIDGLNQVSFDLKEAKKTSDEEIRQLVDLMAALPRLGRELGAAGGGGGGSSDGGRDDRMFAGVRSRHSSLEKGGSPSLVGRNESRRSMDFHSREASEPAPSRFADSHYTRPSTSQQTYSSITTSPSSRFQRDTLQPRPRLPSIPSVRQFVNDARAAADSSSTSTVSAAPFPRTGDSSTSLNSQTLSPPRKRTSVLAHVFDRFSNKQEDPSSSSSSTDKLPSPDRTWRQAKLSSTSTVRATSLFPSGPKVSEPTTAISTVTATHGSPSRTTSGLPLDPDSYDENDESPRPKISATASFLNRARTMSMHPGSGESGPRRGSGDPRRTSFAEDDDTHASGSRKGSNANSEDSAERRRRQSLPPAGSMTSTSPSSVLRRLPGIFGGGGTSPKKKDTTGLP